MAKNEVKYGALISYVMIFINALYGLVAAPYILDSVGAGEYGVYKTIASFTSALIILDLGLGSTMMRYIARFKADGQERKIPNYIAMCFIQAGIIIAILTVVMIVLYFSIDNIYSNGLSLREIEKAKQLFVFLAFGIVAHIIENVFNGIITGYNKFFFGNGLKFIRLIIRIFLIFVLLHFIPSTLVLVIIDLLLTFLLIIIEILYILLKLKIKIRFEHWDNLLFVDSFKYTILMLFTSIAAQINGNLDNVVIGAIIGSVAVAKYSYGLLIFGMFEQISTAISGVMLPTVTNVLVKDDNNYTDTKSLIIKVGRIQFALLGAAAGGFIVIGKRFINLWLGNGYQDVYYIVLILILPAILELCVNVCLSVLRAQNKLEFRTIILFSSTILNAVVTVVGTYFWNYYAAAVGTALSFLIGSVIIMNIYYYKKFRFNMISIYLNIFKGLWICILISASVCWIVAYFVKSQILGLVLPIFAFIIAYLISLFFIGMNDEEKNIFKHGHANKS